MINTSSLLLLLNRKQGLNEMRQLLSKKKYIKGGEVRLKGEPVLIETRCPWGQPPSVLRGGGGWGWGGKEGTGGMGWAHRKGGESGRAGGTQRALHSARGRRIILALCGSWMASRSSTNTPLWLWKGLLCRATDLLDTPSAELVPALKVNTPALDWSWKAFFGMWAGLSPSSSFMLQCLALELHLRRENLRRCSWGGSQTVKRLPFT